MRVLLANKSGIPPTVRNSDTRLMVERRTLAPTLRWLQGFLTNRRDSDEPELTRSNRSCTRSLRPVAA